MKIFNRCDLCKNYDEYCKKYGSYGNEPGDFTTMDCVCNGFELSRYGESILKQEREKKLERILKSCF